MNKKLDRKNTVLILKMVVDYISGGANRAIKGAI